MRSRPAFYFRTAQPVNLAHTALFEPGGVDFAKAAVLGRDVQPLIDERLEGDVALLT